MDNDQARGSCDEGGDIMLSDLTIQEQHLTELKSLVLRGNGSEGAAYVLFGENRVERDPWERHCRRRFTSHEVVAIPLEDIISADAQHITWSSTSFVRLLKHADQYGLVAGIVHSHPNDGPAVFSKQDDLNENELALLARNRNGKGTVLLSVLLSGSSQIRARVWTDQHVPNEIMPVRVVGRRMAFHGNFPAADHTNVLARQALAFGSELNTNIRAMRVGVVGCGGTGSATATLLARLGVGQIALFDEDIVEVTNLNRLHGARQADADAMRPKVDVVARELTEMGLGVRVVPIHNWIGHINCRDALKSCDVIFGCTDDHDGRMLLNRLAYFYLIPVIDMGLAIESAPDGNSLRDLSGRVTVLTPGAPCLLCRGIVDPVRAREEDLKRRQPEEYERRKREAYIRGGGNPAPAVVTFTTAIACLAIDELLQGLTNFRGGDGWMWQRVRRFDLMKDRQPGAIQSPECPVCVDMGYWGRGDIEPFLDRVG